MPEQCFLRWRRQYGDVFTFWMGEFPIVFVADYAKIMETFHKDGETYAGRFIFEELDLLLKGEFEMGEKLRIKMHLGGTFGVIFTEGDHWREQRRFTLHILREFGLGKNLMQEKVSFQFGHYLHMGFSGFE